MAVELACERRLWRTLSPFGTTKVADPGAGAGPSRPAGAAMALLVVAFVLVPVAFVVYELSVADDPAWGTLVLVLLAAPLLLVGALVAHALGSSWWHNGAGHPVLAVDPGVVRGRLHSARRRGPAYDGWDFEVALADITDVRVTGAGHLAFSLPAPLADDLLDRPTTRTHARLWRAITGSPASWPASRMLAPDHRAEHLDRLVAALSGGRPPGGTP